MLNPDNPFSRLYRPDLPGIFNEVSLLETQKDRLKAIADGKTVPPYEVIIHPSGACNLGCTWCIGARIVDKKAQVKSGDILPSKLTDPRAMEKVITDLVKYEREGFRVENVSFSGITGEPLTGKKAFIKAVDILKANGKRVGIFSNSVLIDEELIAALIKIDYINISMDAGTPETYTRLKYGGHPDGSLKFQRLIRNIQALVTARNESGSKLAINASFVLHPESYHELFETAKLLKALGVDTLRMKQDISGGRLLDKEQLQEAELLVAQTKQLEGDGFRFLQVHRLDTPPVTQRTFERCPISDLWAAVGSTGDVFPCNYTATVGTIPYGNAIKTPFHEIWEGEIRHVMKARLPEGCPPMCDPFKTRANIILTELDKTRQKFGSAQTDIFVEELIREASN